MMRFRTIRHRVAALHALVIVVLLGVCGVTLLNLSEIRVDADRLMEEAREQTLAAGLSTAISGLSAMLVQSSSIDPEDLERGREVLRATLLDLEELQESPSDPSRGEHQLEELRIGDRLREHLERVDELLAQFAEPEHVPEALGHLARAHEHITEILDEARSEAQLADRDLERRADSARLMTVGVLVTALLLLGLAMYLIHRTVVRPLRRLRDGVERFGHGELEHRVTVESPDELGELAKTYNVMADRLTHAQLDLEQRVSERTREFLRAARMADLGVLASGIAHEINTPLASIATCAEGLQRRLRSGDAPPAVLTDYAETICHETYRAREITMRMLSLVREEPSMPGDVSLAVVVENALAALRHRAERRGVQLVLEAPPADVTLHVNGGELVQILVNLLSNAVDASGNGDRVVLHVAVQGETLEVEVRDEGEGIPEANLDRIFEPFFTTKRTGEGTGLGLPLVGAMVESHGGRIVVESEPGRGSVFRLTLPVDWSVAA